MEHVSCCKYLGIFIDENMKWKYHIEYVIKKIIRFISIFDKIKDKLPQHCLRSLYFALVYPHITERN